MANLSPHPSRDKWTITKDGAEVSQPWNRWFEDLRTKLNDLIATSLTGTLWDSVDKTGSSLADIEDRKHSDLQNLNTTNYYHLTQENAEGLTGSISFDGHYHNQDRIYARNCAIAKL